MEHYKIKILELVLNSPEFNKLSYEDKFTITMNLGEPPCYALIKLVKNNCIIDGKLDIDKFNAIYYALTYEEDNHDCISPYPIERKE